MQYELSSEVEKVAKTVIKDHLTDLKSKKIVFVTQEKKDDKTGIAVAQMRKGKPIIGDIKLVSGLNAFLASGVDRTDHNGPTPFPALVISRHAWNLLNDEQRKAFVHQQLNRLSYDVDTGKPTLIDYDVREFSIIAKLYGAWNDDLDTFLKAAKEFPLFADLEEAPKAKVVKAAAGNGKIVDEGEKPKSDLLPIKEQVAKKRGARAGR